MKLFFTIDWTFYPGLILPISRSPFQLTDSHYVWLLPAAPYLLVRNPCIYLLNKFMNLLSGFPVTHTVSAGCYSRSFVTVAGKIGIPVLFVHLNWMLLPNFRFGNSFVDAASQLWCISNKGCRCQCRLICTGSNLFKYVKTRQSLLQMKARNMQLSWLTWWIKED